MSVENLENSTLENSEKEKKEKYDAIFQEAEPIAQKIADLAKNENYSDEEVNKIAETLKNLFTKAEKLAHEDINYYGVDIKYHLFWKIHSILKEKGRKDSKVDAGKASGIFAPLKDKEYRPYHQRVIDIWDNIDEILKKENFDLIIDISEN